MFQILLNIQREIHLDLFMHMTMILRCLMNIGFSDIFILIDSLIGLKATGRYDFSFANPEALTFELIKLPP